VEQLKLIQMKVKSKEEYINDNNIQDKVKHLRMLYMGVKKGNETTSDWYCGVTGQEKTKDKFELERIKAHHEESYPNLDTDNIFKVKVDSKENAIAIEKAMSEDGFYTGERFSQPTDENQIWVYIFRMNKK